RPTELGRAKFLPDRLGTLRHAELQLALDHQRVVVDGDVDALLVQTWGQQCRLVAVGRLPDVDRQRLEASRAGPAGAVTGECVVENSVNPLAKWSVHAAIGASAPQIDSHTNVSSLLERCIRFVHPLRWIYAHI